jgi:hypothetical protein
MPDDTFPQDGDGGYSDPVHDLGGPNRRLAKGEPMSSLDEPIDESGADEAEEKRAHRQRLARLRDPVGQALRLKRLGFSVIPVLTDMKDPPDVPWDRAVKSNPAVFLKNSGTRNYGVLPPPGCFGWDVDKGVPALLLDLSKRYGWLPGTITTLTPNGKHLYFRWPENLARPKGPMFGQVVTRWPFGDEGQGYLVGPGSVVLQDDGTLGAYRLLATDENAPIADLPPEWAVAALNWRPASSERPAGSGEVLAEVRAHYELPERVEAGLRYEAIRSYTAHLYNRGVSSEEMWPLVWMTLAPRFAVALTESEVRERFVRAVKDIGERLGPRLRVAGQNERIETTRTGRAWDIAELLSLDIRPVGFLVPGLVPKHGLGLIAGQYKAGKTTFGVQLAMALATPGVAFLGLMPSHTVAAWLNEPEGSLSGFQNRIKDVWEGLGSPDPVTMRLRLMHRALSMKGGPSQGVGDMRRMIDEAGGPPGIWFLGVASKLFGLDDENASAKVQPYLDALDAVADEFDMAVVLSHHLRKNEPKQKKFATPSEFFDTVRGTSAYPGAVDFLLGLDRRPEVRDGRLNVLLRDGETKGVEIEFAYPLFLPPSGRISVVQAPNDRVTVGIGTALMSPNGPVRTTAELAAAIGVTKPAVEKALPLLQSLGLVEVAGTGPRGVRMWQMKKAW